MRDFIKVGNGIFVNLAKRIGYFSMTVPFGASYSVRQPAAEVSARMALAASPVPVVTARKPPRKPGETQAEYRERAQQYLANVREALSDHIPGVVAAFDDISISKLDGGINPQPQDSDYIYPLFRALDAGLIEDYFIDFSATGVLKKSMPLLDGQTIFTNHGKSNGFFGCRSLDVNDWRGAVNQTIWDEKGEQSGGISGINTELKVDWTQDPKLARGLLMKPPAVKAVSVSPYFSWEPSHNELWDTETFWRNLGQEIEGGVKTPAVPEGNIVRMVVGEIFDYLEISFVVKGANANSNRHIEPDGGDEDLAAVFARVSEVLEKREGLSADERARLREILTESLTANVGSRVVPSFAPGGVIPGKIVPILEVSKEKKTVKLTTEQKKALGLEAHTGDEVEDLIVLTAVAALEQRAATAEASVALVQPFIAAERAEVVRLATLVEGITGDDKAVTLPPVFADAIKNATPAQLADWKTMYQKRVDEKFAPKCAKCGSTEVSRRSSVESGAQSEQPPQRIPRSRL